MGILDGQVALVSGAGRGFGQAIAEGLAAEGAQVALLARSLRQIDKVAQGISAKGGTSLPIRCDVSKPAALDAAIDKVEQLLGPVDLLVSNAGSVGPVGPIWEVNPQDWWRAQEVHVRAPMLLMNRLFPGMIERGNGRAICITDRTTKNASPHVSAYSTGKAALGRIVDQAAVELAGTGLSVFAIDPGFVATQLAQDVMESEAARTHRPDLVSKMSARFDDEAAPQDFALCAQRCVDLASGRYDSLSGAYFEPEDDLDAALGSVRAA